MSGPEVAFIRRAALLHDIGKLSVPNAILEKPGKLTPAEWDVVKKHPYYTLEILRRIPGFGELSEVAAAHHEKLDGSGYFRNWGADQLYAAGSHSGGIRHIRRAFSGPALSRRRCRWRRFSKLWTRNAPRALDAGCLEALKLAETDVSQSLAALSSSVGTARNTVQEVGVPHEA